MERPQVAPKEDASPRGAGAGSDAPELSDKPQGFWQRLRGALVTRPTNKIRGLFRSQGPRGKPVSEEASQAFTSAVNSAQALLAKAAIEQERNTVEIEKSRVEIEKLRAETERIRSESRLNDARTRETEANATLVELQARKLEHELLLQQVQTVTAEEPKITKVQPPIRAAIVRKPALLNAPAADQSPATKDQNRPPESGP